MPTCSNCGQNNPEGFSFCGRCGNALVAEAAAPREVRKTVTVVFSDVTGSTALGERLDPETLRRAMGRWFDTARTAVERHGGTVEKFVGDAVMAVFGVPTLHEDDALRAVRAAVEMREALAALNGELERDYGLTIEVRTGVNTGEVVAGEGETLATGDAVNVGARLEQAAQPGEILIGEATHLLVRDAIQAEPVEPLAAKGKSERLTAYRLVELVAGAPPFARRLDAPMVGRESELAQLGHGYERAVRERTAYLFTLLGPAGIGKSRLAHEFLSGIDAEATVLAGRCLPYGEGITYWPLVEILRRAAHHEAPARSDELVADPLAALLGEGEAVGEADEIAWATRRLFERLGRDRPLVVVFDDLQWAETTFLDLVEYLADWTRDAPLLLLCVARPELLEARPAWGGGKLNATSLLLEPLTEDESRRLLESLLAGPQFAAALRERVLEVAEGNPLFVEQMLAMAGDEAADPITVPPTIQALLAARLERLAPEERRVLECAAVIGSEFSVFDAVALAGNGSVRPQLSSLVRKQLVRSESEDVLRFRHLLIRDEAYESLPKELRAELHERYADRLEEASGERAPELEEIVGYHLEQAHGYRVEIALPDASTRALGERAGRLLGAAGRRALDRGDVPAALSLLDRSTSVLPAEHPLRSELMCSLASALRDNGELARARAAAEEAVRVAQALDDRGGRVRAKLRLAEILIAAGEPMEEFERRVRESIPALEELGDDVGLSEALFLQGLACSWTGRGAQGLEMFERAAELARRAGHARVDSESSSWACLSAFWGPTPVEECLRLCDRMLARPGTSPRLEASTLVIRGVLKTMIRPDDDSGRAEIEAGYTLLEQLGNQVLRGAQTMSPALTNLFRGSPELAELDLRRGYELLAGTGEDAYLSTIAALLALALAEQGRLAEAEPLVEESRRLGAEDDTTTQVYWRAGKAQLLTAAGAHDEAVGLAHEAVSIVGGTDMHLDRHGAFRALAAAAAAKGDRETSEQAFREALAIAEAKGDLATASYLRGLDAQL